MTFITAVIPVYNDNLALEKAIPESIARLESLGRPFELIIAEDASTDGTKETAANWAKKDARIIHLHSDIREGRGKALNRALSIAKGDIFCYYDVDLATSMEYLGELLARIENGAAIATGSRLMKNSSISRTKKREIASRGYNFLVRKLLKSKLRDHQCGFKAYNTAVLRELVKKIEDPHWFWDTESLVLAQHDGLRIDEFPIIWTQGPGTTVRMKDILSMGRSILKLRKRLK